METYGADAAATWISRYIEEDLGPGDVTTDAVIGRGDVANGVIVVREPCVVAGLSHVASVFDRFGVATSLHVADGDEVAAGAQLASVSGSARAILRGERLALNILGRMSGIATTTRRLQARLQEVGSVANVAGTRKTTPGFRVFEKEAIAVGGGDPHRHGLWDVAMVKDNHRAAAGHVASAVAAIRAQSDVPIIVEVESLDDGLAATNAGAEWILVDNQSPEVGTMWANACRAARQGVLIEASGGITEANLIDYAWADRISMGALTQAACAVDVSLEWQQPGGRSQAGRATIKEI